MRLRLVVTAGSRGAKVGRRTALPLHNDMARLTRHRVDSRFLSGSALLLLSAKAQLFLRGVSSSCRMLRALPLLSRRALCFGHCNRLLQIAVYESRPSIADFLLQHGGQ